MHVSPSPWLFMISITIIGEMLGWLIITFLLLSNRYLELLLYFMATDKFNIWSQEPLIREFVKKLFLMLKSNHSLFLENWLYLQTSWGWVVLAPIPQQETKNLSVGQGDALGLAPTHICVVACQLIMTLMKTSVHHFSSSVKHSPFEGPAV